MRMISAILESKAFNFICRLVLTLPFWSAGITKVVNWQGGVAEMTHFGLQPAPIYNAATAVTEIVGSLLILFGPYAWLGAGWLGIFTVLTIPIAHAFWTMPEPQRTLEMYTAEEHLAMVGGLALAAILRHRDTRR
jgi:transmembrane protein